MYIYIYIYIYILECARRYPSTMAFSGAAVLLHMQKFWIISAALTVLMALEQRFECKAAPS